MSINLPERFEERMRQQLGSELPAFLHALQEPPARGLRLNPLKPSDAAARYNLTERIPWSEGSYFIPADSSAGAGILHAAGAFYIQEPGAMIPAEVLNAQPGETVLDFCAAPGGKSTQIGCAMKGEGLLVCNEPVPKRAQILSGNIERIGLPNTIVTCEWPQKLARQWPEAFDAVLVDAPCSGEGMFRRDPETRNEWTAEKASGCAARQREILSAAASLVRPGGRLVYSTCTYNPAENEENVRWFTENFAEFHSEPFALPGIDAAGGMFTCYPHRLKGEGQFAALFRKDGDAPARMPEDHSLKTPSGAEYNVFRSAFPSFPEPTHIFGNTYISVPKLPDLNGIRSIRIGLHLGETRGKTAVPDHAAALCFRSPAVRQMTISPEQAVKYISGETIPGEAEGWVLVRCLDLNIGWGKGSGGVIKNHYPKGLRNSRTSL